MSGSFISSCSLAVLMFTLSAAQVPLGIMAAPRRDTNTSIDFAIRVIGFSSSLRFDDLQVIALEFRLFRDVVLADTDAKQVLLSRLHRLNLFQCLFRWRLFQRIRALAFHRAERFRFLIVADGRVDWLAARIDELELE